MCVRTHSNTQYLQASVPLLCLRWEGLHMRRTAMDLRVGPSLEEMTKPCALRVPGSSAIGGRRVAEEALLTTAPPLPFPSPNQHSTLWSTLLHTGCIMWGKREAAFGPCPLLEAHFMLVCSFSFVIVFGKSYSTGRASQSSSTPNSPHMTVHFRNQDVN